jgi:hypothetical protein
MGWKRSVRVEFDDFGRSMLEVAARRTGQSIEDLLCEAAHRSVAGNSRPVPRLRELVPAGSSGEVATTLELPPAEWQALEAEAARQNVPVEQLLEHAALHLVADLDLSPRATTSA